MNNRTLGRQRLAHLPRRQRVWLDRRWSYLVLDARVDAGLNFIDTANVYSRWAPKHTGGESKTVIGKWLKQSGKRYKVVIATKIGLDLCDGKVGLAPKRIRETVEASLGRLGIDQIDLYQAHQEYANTPLQATLEAYG